MVQGATSEVEVCQGAGALELVVDLEMTKPSDQSCEGFPPMLIFPLPAPV